MKNNNNSWTECHGVTINKEWDTIELIGRFTAKDFVTFDIFTKQYENDPVIILMVSRDRQLGVIDSNGDVIIPAIYDHIMLVDFADRIFFKVTSNGNEGIVCLNKNILIPLKWAKIIPVHLSNKRKNPEFCWSRNANYIICIEALENPGIEEKLTDQVKKKPIRFSIYNKFFELVTPEGLDGCAVVESVYTHKQHTCYLACKQNDYGIIACDAKTIIDMGLSFEEAIKTIRKIQKISYVKHIIDYIKDSYKKINQFIKQVQKGQEEQQEDDITKNEIIKFALKAAVMLDDLKAFRMAEWARSMKILIEKEKCEELLSIIGDLLEWLQSLKANPELIFEDRAMIEEEYQQEVQPLFNRGFTEVVLNSENEYLRRKEVLK